MTQYFVFLQKEIVENVRNYKLFLLLIAFTLFGILNPLVAKLTPVMIESLIPAGSFFPIPEPTAVDSWAQFFKNINQIGFLIILLVFSGILITELASGTLINLLTKGLSRQVVILSKFTVMILIWSLSLLVCFAVTWIYTIYLFPSDDINHLGFAIFCLWLFGVLLLALLIFASTFSSTIYAVLLLVGMSVGVGILVNLFPRFQKYNPHSLISRNMDLVTGSLNPSDLSLALWITGGLIIVSVFSALFVFRKKQLP